MNMSAITKAFYQYTLTERIKIPLNSHIQLKTRIVHRQLIHQHVSGEVAETIPSDHITETFREYFK
jgi:hypothetical protein